MQRNESIIEIDPQIPTAFLDEYIDFRTRTVWSKTLGYLKSFYRSDKPIRTAECNDLKKRFDKPLSGQSLAEIIIKAGELSRKAQTESSDQSSYAQALHSTRTYYIKKTLASSHRDDYLEEVEKVRSEFNKVKEKIRITNGKNLDVSHLQIERQNLYQTLIEMHDKATLDDAVDNSFFPKATLPSKEQQALLSKFSILEINPNIPLIYQAQYYLIDLILIIKADEKRERYFTSILKHPDTPMLPHYKDPVDEILHCLSLNPTNEAASDINYLLNKEMQSPGSAPPSPTGVNDGEEGEEYIDEGETVDVSPPPSRKGSPASIAQQNLFTGGATGRANVTPDATISPSTPTPGNG